MASAAHANPPTGVPMAQHFDAWLERLSGDNLPVLRRTAKEIERLAAKGEKASVAEIANVLLLDPLATLRLLQVANSLRRGRFGSEITTIEHAVMMLGLPPFFARFRNLPVVEDQFGGQPQALHRLLSLLSRSHHAAVQAGDWAVWHKDMKAEEIYIAALLQGWMEPLLWLRAPEAAAECERRARNGAIPLEAAQAEVLGVAPHELQSALAQAWHLPELLLDLMGAVDPDIRTRAFGVNLAVSVARHSDQDWYGAELATDFESASAFLHLPVDAVSSMVHRSAVAAARRWEWYGVAPAAARLPMLPGRLLPAAVEQQPAGVDVCLMPQHDKLEGCMGEIAAHLDATLDLHDMMGLVLKGMHDGIGLNRVVFALLTTDRSKVRAKYVVGAEAGSMLRNFEFDMNMPHLFARLMEKMQGIWLNSGNRARFRPLIPAEIRALTGDGEFFAMSVFVHDKAVGLFYADRGHGSCALDERSYQEFKQLCLRAAQGLGHLAKS